MAASLERSAVLSFKFLETLLSNSFLTSDAMESKMISFTPLDITSSSSLWSLTVMSIHMLITPSKILGLAQIMFVEFISGFFFQGSNLPLRFFLGLSICTLKGGREEKRYLPMTPHAPQPGANLLSSPKHICRDTVQVCSLVTPSDACWYCIALVWLSTEVSHKVGDGYRVPLWQWLNL